MADEETTPADEISGESVVTNVVNNMIEPADHHHEKSWWQSKKFIAFLGTEGGLFALMGAMIYTQEMDKVGENVAFMVLAVTAGFLATGFILGQASLDRYVRVAKIAMGKGMLSKNTEPDKERDGPTD